MPRLMTFWFASLIAVACITAAVVRAQQPRVILPQLLSGGDVGVRISGADQKGLPIGEVVVRIDGEWLRLSDNPRVRRVN